MTKEQLDEMERLAEWWKMTQCKFGELPTNTYQAGYTAGVESERKRAQILFAALEVILSGLSSKGPRPIAFDALTEYQKGDEI